MEILFDAAAILESIADSFFALDVAGRFKFVTAKAGEILGKRPAELLGKTFLEAFPAMQETDFYQNVMRSLDEGSPSRFDHFDDRLNRWFEHQTYIQSDGGIAVYGRDITARRRLEDALRTSEVRFRHLAEATKILSSSLDIVRMLRDLTKFLAATMGDVCVIFVREEGELLQVAAASKSGADVEAVDLSATPQMRTVMNRGVAEVLPGQGVLVPLPSHGRIAGALFLETESQLAPDDLHLLEEVGRRAGIALDNTRLYQQTELASRLKDEFVAALSHELRTPLTPILGAVYMLRTEPQDARVFNKALDLIERNAKAQSRIIEDLLDVSRIISGKLRLRQEPVEIDAVIHAALDAIRPASDAKRISLDMSLAPLGGAVYGDSDRLQQIFWNILSNSVKFTPSGGRVSVGLAQNGDHAEVQIVDNGIGIGEEFLPFVFDRFRQADTSRTRLHGGLGIGLAIVRHLVESHGGTVHVHSLGKQKGSTFVVKLPLRFTLNKETLSRSAAVKG